MTVRIGDLALAAGIVTAEQLHEAHDLRETVR
jgi:hypothetical protein